MNTVHPMLTHILAMGDPAIWETSLRLAEEGLSGLAAGPFERVYFVGHGSSLYNGMVGKYVLEHIVGIPAEAFPAFVFARYAEPALLGPGTLVVGISTTGTTKSACDALEVARRGGSPTLAVTAYPGSAITEGAQAVVLTGGEDDRPLVKTKSYVQALVPLYLLALHLAGGSAEREYWFGQVRLAAEGARRFLEGQRGEVEALAQEFAPQADKVFVLGSGPNWGTAEESSLKVIEMAKMYSECQELEDFFHGRLREVEQTAPFFFLAPQGRASRRVLDFLTVTGQIGVPSVVLTDQASPALRRLATRVVELPGGLDEYATPLLYTIPMHLFCYELALLRGHDPAALRYGIDAHNVFYQGEAEQ